MLEHYIPIFLMIIVGLGFGIVNLKAAEWLGPKNSNSEKASTYESGMRPIRSAHERFSVKFYLVAMIFILFDIEIVFMYPWAVRYQTLGIPGMVAMALFMIILFAGFIYVVRKGALQWD